MFVRNWMFPTTLSNIWNLEHFIENKFQIQFFYESYISMKNEIFMNSLYPVFIHLKHLVLMAGFGRKYNNSATACLYLWPFHFFVSLWINEHFTFHF